MNKTEFKLRMKSLKSYRELNPGKGYWDWKVELFEDGGEVPPDNSPVHINLITGKPLANGTITPVLDLEGAANFTPIGDALSIRDLYTSTRDRDWLGVGIAGLSLLPFVPKFSRNNVVKKTVRPIPEVHPNYFQEQMQKMQAAMDKKKQVTDEFYKQQDNAYESLIDNEDAFRRAVNADNTAGTRYKDVYSEYLRKYNQRPSKNNDDLILMRLTDDIPSNTKAQVNPNNLDWININDRYANPNELDPMFLLMNPGLVRHELGHITDEKAGLDYVDRLGKRSKFEPEERLKEMYPNSYKTIQSYLLKGSEIKSHMNEFREFLRNKHEDSVKETVRSIREKLDRHKDEFRNLKVLFDAYKSKRQFVRDYNTIPLIGTSALGINYYLNQLEEK